MATVVSDNSNSGAKVTITESTDGGGKITVVNARGPQGIPGTPGDVPDGIVLSVNTNEPDVDGDVTLTASDVGAEEAGVAASLVSAEAATREQADDDLIAGFSGIAAALVTEIDDRTAADALLIPLTQKGAASGVAELDSGGLVPSAQLPSYVDDVIEAANFAALPGTGATGKIYVTLDDNKTYRWSGSAYVEISSSLALGETSSTAYRGDRGKTAYDHSQSTGNPHGTTKSDVGLGSVDNVSVAAIVLPTDTLANRPSAVGRPDGTQFTANDNGIIYRVASGAWTEWKPGFYRGTATEAKSPDDIIARAGGAAVKIGANGPGGKGSIAIGVSSDTVWYRDAADTWRTADAVIIDGATTLNGASTAPTASPGDNDTTIATTAFVKAEIPLVAAPKTPTVGTSLGTSGTVDLDLAALDGTIQWITATGNITFTTSNRAAGRGVRIFVDAGGSGRTLTYPSWIAHGAALDTALASGKRMAISILSLGTTDANISAVTSEQP